MRWWPYAVAGGATLPWLIAVGAGLHPAHAVTAALAGIAILGAAFLLSWGCEVAEMDVPQAIAVSLLALVAVLPEYAVDATFAWKAAAHPENAGYAIANMTGGNRLLLGVGWPLVVIIAWWRGGNRGSYKFHVQLPADMGVEVAVLLLATLYAAVPVYRGSLTLVDTAVYVVMYLAYLVAGARTEGHEPEIVGPAAVLAELGTGLRRASVVGMFIFAAGAIFLAAEPFAEALVATGRELGIDEFLLVQWVAPFASEAPEAVVAILLTLRGAPAMGMRTLVSSKVNQWTLLVGTLAVVYSVASGGPAALPLDERQRTEVMLTAAQSLFGIFVLADLKLQLWQALSLLVLFFFQILGTEAGHLYEGIAYIALSVIVLVVDKNTRDGIFTQFGRFGRLLAGRPSPASH